MGETGLSAKGMSFVFRADVEALLARAWSHALGPLNAEHLFSK